MAYYQVTHGDCLCQFSRLYHLLKDSDENKHLAAPLTGGGLNWTCCSVILTSTAVSQLQPLFPVTLSTLDVIHWGGMFQSHTAAIWSAGRMVDMDLIIFISASSSLFSPTECRFVSFLIHVPNNYYTKKRNKKDKYIFFLELICSTICKCIKPQTTRVFLSTNTKFLSSDLKLTLKWMGYDL